MKKIFFILAFACAFLSAESQKKIPTEEEVLSNPLHEYTLRKNEILDVIYPGKGWIFLGVKDKNGGSEQSFIFLGRLTEEERQTFSFRAKESGEFLLGFYKTDFLTNSYIDDCIKVTVENTNGDPTKRTSANNYTFRGRKYLEEPLDEINFTNKEKEIETQEVSPKNEKNPKKGLKTNIDEAKGENADMGLKNKKPYISPLEEAKINLEKGEYEKCKVALDNFFSYESNYEDEGIFVLASFYEALRNKNRNIKAAIASYDALCKNYPESAFWNAARERLIYLQRFYIDIR